MSSVVLNRTVAPVAEPITLNEAKDHLRVTHALEDTLVTSLIMAAREQIEDTYLKRSLLLQTWEYCLDAWPAQGFIRLPRPPLQALTSVNYLDQQGVSSPLDPTSFVTDTRSEPGRVVLLPNCSWPTVSLYSVNPIRILYVAGYTQAALVPEVAKQAIKLLLSNLYIHRDDEDAPGRLDAVSRLLSSWEVRSEHP